LLTDSRITNCGGTGFTGNHLARIQAYPHTKTYAVLSIDCRGHSMDLALDLQSGQTGAQGVVLECHRRSEHGHDPVAGELVDRGAVPLYHRDGAIDQLGDDFAEPFGADHGRHAHRVHHVGEEHGDLLYSA
jgi:hypothetical protein